MNQSIHICKSPLQISLVFKLINKKWNCENVTLFCRNVFLFTLLLLLLYTISDRVETFCVLQLTFPLKGQHC